MAQKLAQYGTPKQAKYAIKCICQLCPVNKDTLLQPVFDVSIFTLSKIFVENN